MSLQRRLAQVLGSGYRKPGNTVNLGNLYTVSPRRQRRGFAFFEDGSIFISRDHASNSDHEQNHDHFEADMKLLQSFVRHPTPSLQSIRQSGPDRQRLLLVQTSDRTGTIQQVLARNVSDGEYLPLGQPFQEITLETDLSHSHLLSFHLHHWSRHINKKILGKIRSALHDFRGTLVDGVLQPRLRLGNAPDREQFWDTTDSAHSQMSSDSAEMGGSIPVKYRDVATKDRAMGPNDIVPKSLNRTAQRNSRPAGAKGRRRDYTPKTVQPKLLHQREAEQSYHQEAVWLRQREAERQHEAEQLHKRQLNLLRQQEARLKAGEERLLRLQQTLLERTMALPPTHSNHPANGVAGLDPRLLDVEARERELQERENALKWKRRSFLLEKKLAMAGIADAPYSPENWSHAPTSSPRPDTNPFKEAPGPNSSEAPDPGSSEEGPDHGPWTTPPENSPPDPFADFDVEASPRIPKRIRQGRTRIRLPR